MSEKDRQCELLASCGLRVDRRITGQCMEHFDEDGSVGDSLE